MMGAEVSAGSGRGSLAFAAAGGGEAAPSPGEGEDGDAWDACGEEADNLNEAAWPQPASSDGAAVAQTRADQVRTSGPPGPRAACCRPMSCCGKR